MTLEHITVLDLTHMLSGPYGTMLLADLGARTIKVEPPGNGEGTRRLQENDPHYSRDGMGSYFLTLNRNKSSVCVDLKSEAGREVFMDLVRAADVVFDNFSAGVTRRLGIHYEVLAQVNPRIITCSVTGFGQTGPATQRPAFDQVIQAMGGGMSITGTPQTGPIRAGIPIGDLCGGLFGALGVLAAIAERERTGRGQEVDISMLDAQVSLLNYMGTMHLMSGHVPEGIGNAHFVHVPYNCYPTSDGHIIVACIGDHFFERFVEFIQLPELQREDYRQQPVRYADRERIDALLREVFKTRSSAEWLEGLQRARIPCGPVNDMDALFKDPQVLARNMVVEYALASGGSIRAPGNPVKLSNAGEQRFSPPPRLAEQTVPVLRDLLKYDAARIERLRAAGAIA